MAASAAVVCARIGATDARATAGTALPGVPSGTPWVGWVLGRGSPAVGGGSLVGGAVTAGHAPVLSRICTAL